MTRDQFLESSEQEAFKLLIHLGLLSLGVTCAMYNLGSFLARKERQLALNTLGYSTLVGWEVTLICRHWNTIRRDNHVRCEQRLNQSLRGANADQGDWFREGE